MDDDFAAAYVELADYRRRVHEMYAAARGGTALVLDSNYGHHPSCVYSPRWSCPWLPPATGSTPRSPPASAPAHPDSAHTQSASRSSPA
ncbi:MAG TPA: hypothetical protein VGC11_06835 [Acidimicrobiia bacterium]